MTEPIVQSIKEEKTQFKKATRQESKNSSASDNEEQDNSTIRCPCENNTDHGLMIQCETCLVWQHSLCVGIREDRSVPPHYYCELCLPRNFNCICKQNNPVGKLVQCTKCNTWQHCRCLGKAPRTLPKPYLCPSCDPEGWNTIKQQKKPSTGGKKGPKKKMKEFEFINSPTLREEFERDFALFKGSGNIKNEVANNINGQFDKLIFKYCIKYCDIPEDKVEIEDIISAISTLTGVSVEVIQSSMITYGNEIISLCKSNNSSQSSILEELYSGWSLVKENRLSNSVRIQAPPPDNKATCVISLQAKLSGNPIPSVLCFDEKCTCRRSNYECLGAHCVCGCTDPNNMHVSCSNRIQDPLAYELHCMNSTSTYSSWGILIQENAYPYQFIMEYFGIINSIKELDFNNLPNKDRPYILLRSHLDLCVDARSIGGHSRFIRRSCKPTAEVREVYGSNGLHFGIYALTNLHPKQEITVAFDYSWKDSKIVPICACNSSNCEISNYFNNRNNNASKLVSHLVKKQQLQQQLLQQQQQQQQQQLLLQNQQQQQQQHQHQQQQQQQSVGEHEEEEKPKKKRKTFEEKNKLAAASMMTQMSSISNTSSQPGTPTTSSSSSIKGLESPREEKLSREERKIAMVMKSFQKIENRQNRKRNKVVKEPHTNNKEIKKLKKSESSESLKSDTDSSNENEVSTPKAEGNGSREYYATSPTSPIVGRSTSLDTIQSTSSSTTINITTNINNNNNNTNYNYNPVTSSTSTEDASPPNQAASSSSNKFNKFGKKAWILEYQRETTSNATTTTTTTNPPPTTTTVTTAPTTTTTTAANSTSVPFKKKFLDNFLSNETSTTNNTSEVSISAIQPTEKEETQMLGNIDNSNSTLYNNTPVPASIPDEAQTVNDTNIR